MHHLIQAVLRQHGVESRGVVCGEEQKLGDVLCFLHQTPADVLVGRQKVVGSAQRKRHGALMQHGSILLDRSPFAPQLPGVNDLAGTAIDAETLRSELVKAFAAVTGWELVPQEWTKDERRQIDELAAAKYGSDDWTRKR
jgi:lipoate-protein ligase A